MSPRPQALLLDFGGVLTTDLWESIRAATRRAGLPPDAVLELMGIDPEGRRLFHALERGQITQADYEAYLAARLGVPAAGLLADLCADLRPNTPLWDFVAVVHGAGVRTALLSNSWGAGAFSPYAGWEFTDRVDAVVLSHEVGLRKPDPQIFTHTLARLGVPAANAVFVDDVADNLVPAQALGMTVIHHNHAATATTLHRLADLFGVSMPDQVKWSRQSA